MESGHRGQDHESPLRLVQEETLELWVVLEPRQPAWLYRRLPSLLYRRFPNLRAVERPDAHPDSTAADLEIGDTAGLETCATGFIACGAANA